MVSELRRRFSQNLNQSDLGQHGALSPSVYSGRTGKARVQRTTIPSAIGGRHVPFLALCFSHGSPPTAFGDTVDASRSQNPGRGFAGSSDLNRKSPQSAPPSHQNTPRIAQDRSGPHESHEDDRKTIKKCGKDSLPTCTGNCPVLIPYCAKVQYPAHCLASCNGPVTGTWKRWKFATISGVTALCRNSF